MHALLKIKLACFRYHIMCDAVKEHFVELTYMSLTGIKADGVKTILIAGALTYLKFNMNCVFIANH